jgi:membrane-associated phospholipid phosphatase
MLHTIDLICPALRNPLIATMMTPMEYLGHGAVATVIGLGLMAYGHFYKDSRIRHAGIAVFVALMIAAGIATTLKHGVQLPHPRLPSAFELPSGRTSAVFAVASALSVAFPTLSPVFYSLALLAGIARLYSRAHYIWSVVGGAVIGVAAGLPTALKLIPPGNTFRHSSMAFLGWAGTAVLGFSALAFFYTTENNIAAHLIDGNNDTRNHSVVASLDFGTGATRPSLLYGWSGDESWEHGTRSVVWAEGLASELVVNLPQEQDYRFRFDLFPYFRNGPACQRVEVRVNKMSVATVWLEQGWHWYEFDVPKTAVHSGRNFIKFDYGYADQAPEPDERRLSVAFDILELLPKSH